MHLGLQNKQKQKNIQGLKAAYNSFTNKQTGLIQNE